MTDVEVSENDNWNILMEVSLFADRMAAPGLHNAAIDLHIEASLKTKQIPTLLFGYVWSNTDETSLLRAFLIALTVRAGNVADLCRSKSDRAHFTLDMMVEMLEYAQEVIGDDEKPTTFEFWQRRCKWHVHKEGKLCSDKKE